MTPNAMLRQINSEAQKLPAESLPMVMDYIKYLQFQMERKNSKPKRARKYANLEGILKGVDVSPRALSEARQEMWKKFKDAR
jgi:hypothetical protein